MKINDLQAAMEAILFASGEPISLEKIAEAVDIRPAAARQLLDDLAERMKAEHRGVELIALGENYQLCTKAQYAEPIRRVLETRRNTPLSQAAMEVLAIIAYNQPVTRAFVEQIRGVDSSATVSGLVNKGLIEERGRLELPGRPLLYGTTDQFLRCFQISSLAELPPIHRPDDASVSWEQAQEDNLPDANDLSGS